MSRAQRDRDVSDRQGEAVPAAGAQAPHRRSRRSTLIAFALGLLLVLVAAASAGAAKQSLDVNVTTCDENGCETEEHEVDSQTGGGSGGGSAGGSGGGSGGGGGSSSSGGEVHDIDLNSGSSRVKTPSGRESVTLDLNSKDQKDQAAPVAPDAGADKGKTGGTKTPDRDLPDATSGAPRSTVSTSGGKFDMGSAFDFVSTDQALSSFAIPPFLVPIYVSAGRAYDVPWNVLASINQIETDFGRLGACAVSYAGARGWMQFMPGTWDAYGVDASGDGVADPCNPVDAIYAAARYLDASGASTDLRSAVFAYNHADWYVDRVLATASVYGSLPSGLVTETGSLAFGHFPVAGQVRYGDDFRLAQSEGRRPRGLLMHPRGRAKAIATQDVTVTRVLLGPGLAEGLRDRSGDVIKRLESHSPRIGVSAIRSSLGDLTEIVSSATGAPAVARLASSPLDSLQGLVSRVKRTAADRRAARDGERKANAAAKLPPLRKHGPVETSGDAAAADKDSAKRERSHDGGPTTDGTASARLAAGSGSPELESDGADTQGSRAEAQSARKAQSAAGKKDDGLPRGFEAVKTSGIGVEVRDSVGNRYRYSGLRDLRDGIRPGLKLDAKQALGELRGRKGAEGRPMLFETIGAGGAAVDPRPLVDGYRLQETANYYHAVEPFDGNPFVLDQTLAAAGGRIEGTQEQLARRVLADDGISIYPCGRQDISRGIVDKRVLGALLYLRKAGLTMTVTSLRCGHGFYTASGNVSAHSYGAAVDIAAFNGQPVLGNQGPGSLTAQAVKLLMQLEGEAQPSQLISLMDFGGPSFALSDHHDHLHVGYDFQPSLGLGRDGKALSSVVFGGSGSTPALGQPDDGKADKDHERRLSERLGKIENPRVLGRRGAGSVTIEGEARSDRRAAERLARRESPIEIAPTSAGAEVLAVDAPDGAGGKEAYALARVDGSAGGWAKRQVVLLAYTDDAWTFVGPPRNRRGEVVNPALEALATVSGGEGFAVGDDGAVARLRGKRPPLVVSSKVDADLGSVAVSKDGDDAVAAGPKDSVLRIARDGRAVRQRVEQIADGLTVETVDTLADGTVAAAGSAEGGKPALYQSSGGGWQAVPLKLNVAPDAALRLTAVAGDEDELWIGGAIADQATIGSASELSFAARRQGGSWRTFCSVDPALAAVRELGQPSQRPCDGTLVSEGDQHGAAAAVAVTPKGAVVATGDALQLLRDQDKSFRPVPAPSGSISSLALSGDGRGWLVGGDGRIARVGPAGGSDAEDEAAPALLPISDGGQPAAVAAAPGGGRALAFAGAGSSLLADRTWRDAPEVGIGVRDAAWQSAGLAWAIDETGALLTLRDGEWKAVGFGWADPELRQRLADSVGAGPVSGPELEGSGLLAIAFRSPAEGYAVGSAGLIERYEIDDGWSREPSPTDATLNDVAAGPGGVVAVGDGGTLLERGDGAWAAIAEVAELVAERDITAADAMHDGTMLAVAGGAVIEREADGPWSLADLPPLGRTVERIGGYRTDKGQLRVVALVSEGSASRLLQGTPDGWRSLEPPAGMAVSDFAPRPGSHEMWVVGEANGRAAVAEMSVSGELLDGADVEAASGPAEQAAPAAPATDSETDSPRVRVLTVTSALHTRHKGGNGGQKASRRGTDAGGGDKDGGRDGRKGLQAR